MSETKTSTELGIEYFIETQTDEKLKRENIKDIEKVNETYFKVVGKVKETIEELGGIMPED